MKNQYKILAETAKTELTIELSLIETLKQMEAYTQFTVSELANTAIKRFVSHHKDFLPPPELKKK